MASSVSRLPGALDSPAGVIESLRADAPRIKSIVAVIEYLDEAPNVIRHTYSSRASIAYAAVSMLLYAQEALRDGGDDGR